MSTGGGFRAAGYIAHMLEAITLARSYAAGLDKVEFLADKKTQQAIVMNLLIIGEAASQLADREPDFVHLQSHIPWKSMRGMRHRLAHGYFDTNLDVVWDTVQRDLPDLERKLRSLA